MPKTTPDDVTLERFVQGKLSRRENLKIAWHLFNSPESRLRVEELGGGKVLQSLFKDLEIPDAEPAPSYERAFSFSRSTLEVQGETRDRDLMRAPKLFAELMRHPVSRQRKLIERTWRFKNYVFAEFLLDQAQGYFFNDPARSEDLAELALAVGQQLEGTHYGPALVNDLKAKAWGYLANARRIGSEFRGADDALAEAYEHLEKGTDDPLLKARILSFDCLLRGDQRDFERGFQRIDEALQIYREAGEKHMEGRALLTKAHLLETNNEAEEAIEVLQSALGLVDLEREPRLAGLIKQNLANYLTQIGEYKQAAKLLPELRKLADQHNNSLDLLRTRALEARVAVGLKKWKEAEKALIEVRDGFVKSDICYDAAVISLDLALVYAQQGRTADMKKLAQEMIPIFKSRDIHREAHAALIIFQQAVQAEEASLHLLEEIAGYLKQARNNPELQYKAS
jgi:tetratricopeptide (TPR) repeat protein